jgi:hypothetical protein
VESGKKLLAEVHTSPEISQWEFYVWTESRDCEPASHP